MTESSYLEGRGLKAAAITHTGPKAADRLVKAYDCHVHPLKLGQKAPASENGLKDALPDASEITGNYGVACGRSKIVAVDLDDYVPDNEIQVFLDTFQLPPTFTISTGSGGRSMWFRAPEGIDLTQKLGFMVGVDIKAGESYVVGPGSKLHPDFVKKGAPGDGIYAFVKESPKEFAPLPEALTTALIEARPTMRAEIDIDHAAYDAMAPELRGRVDAYVRDALARNLFDLNHLKRLSEGERDDKGYGWEEGSLQYGGAIAQLVKADWTGLDYEQILALVKEAAPGSGDIFSHNVGLFVRAVSKDDGDYPPRAFPPALLEEQENWWPDNLDVVRPFVEAAGSSEPPAAEVVTVDVDVDDWPKEPWNEEGHVARTKMWAAGSLRWLTDEQVWVRYNGTHWERDPQAGAKSAERAMKIARHTEALNYDDQDKVDEKTGQTKPNSSELAKFVKALSDQSTDRMFNSVARVLGRREGVESDSTAFDCDDMLLGVANGTIDLRTGELLPGTPEQMISMACPVAFDPAATAPRFQEFLRESIPSEDVRLYLQRVIGYSITGSRLEQAMFMHYGEATNNGKSVLITVLERMSGEYSGVADPKALIESRNDQHTTHIAGLAGPRLLMMSETARGARLSDVLVKQITGGDTIKARKMHENGQNYRIKGKIHLATNHLPHIVSSPSTNRRIHVIPWTVQIENDKIDLQLADKLTEELPGILNWVIEGAKLWWVAMHASQNLKDGERPSGLGMPVEVRQATDAYLGDEDEMGRWLEERTDGRRDVFETASNLYENYKWWAEKQGTRPMTQAGFSLDLKKRGIEQKRTKTARGFMLTLRPIQERSFFDG